MFAAPPTNMIEVSGNIEAHQSVLSFAQVSAPIVYLPFDDGAQVTVGTVLARVDDRPYRDQLEMDQAALQASRAQLAVDISARMAAEQTVRSDAYDLLEKSRDYARAEYLAKHSAVSRQTRDHALTAAQQADAMLARDQAQVQVASNNIALAEAQIASAAARVRLDRVTLGYTVLRAPFSGVIAVREAELGELASPGIAIFSLDDLNHVWLRAYVIEPDLGKVRLGEAVSVTTDTYRNKTYHGYISFISPVAEFTPKTVETHAERITLVYRIRIDINNPTHELLPGMPADAHIRLLPSGYAAYRHEH